MTESDNKDGRQSTLDTNDNIMGVVDSSIRGIHGAMEAMYSRFEKTSQQTLEMTAGMAHLMERMYRANIKIASTFKPAGNGNIHMSLMISNKTNLPITAMTGVLEFENTEIDIVYSSAHQQQDKALPNLFKSPCNLAPQECYKQDIEIHINEIKQCNGAITLSIKHPLAPRETIALKHTFGLYLIDQLRKEILDNKLDLELVDRLYYPVAFLRDIFEIQAIKGINSGMCVALSSPKYKIVCEIISVSDDANSVEVEFTSNHPALAKQLIKELSILCTV